MKLSQRIVRAAMVMMSPRARLALRELLGPWTFADPNNFFAGGVAGYTSLVSNVMRVAQRPEDEIRGSARRLRDKARELERTNPYITTWQNHLVANIVGPDGIGFQARNLNPDGTMNEALNAHVEDRFRDWCNGGVTRDGQMTLDDFDELGVRTTATDGEVFVRKVRSAEFRHGLALEFIDAALVDEELNETDPRTGFVFIRNGIEYAPNGKRLAYWTFRDYDRARPYLRIPAEEIVHVFRAQRVNQVRGLSWAMTVLTAAKLIDAYEMAELIQSQIAASKGGFFENTTEGASEEGEWSKDDSTPITMTAAPGVAEKLPKGWTFKEWSPNHPSSQFQPFIKTQLRKKAGGLRMPYHELANDLENVTYSSLREGKLITRDHRRRDQRFWISSFRERMFVEWMQQSYLMGELRLPTPELKLYAAHEFRGRGFPWVDPLKEIAAEILAIQWGLDSRTEITAEGGKDIEEVFKNLARENKLADKEGIEITAAALEAAAAAGTEDEADTEEGRDRAVNRVAAILRTLTNGKGH